AAISLLSAAISLLSAAISLLSAAISLLSAAISLLYRATVSASFQTCIRSLMNFHQSLKVNFVFILFAKVSEFPHQL
ncbi:MAG: hypothetical protein IE878_00715, partial [Epsilonproteobacteria bacterium]|nr:hypothetical protein [Campylobacterota bacterium]